MGKATGVFLILAGVGTAALILPAVDKDAERQLADVVRIATGNAAGPVDTKTSTAVASVAVAPIAAAVAPPRSRVEAQPSNAKVTAVRPPASDQEPSVRSDRAVPSGTSGKVALTAPADLMPPPHVVTKNTTTAVRADDTQARITLARDIQRELKRVGCYDGDVSGEWNAGTRRAMKTFVEKVNAALPTDEPDHILRTMVQGHPGNACGRGSIVAQNSSIKSTAKLTEKVSEKRELVQRDPAVSQRDAGTVRPTVPKPAWETTVAAVPSVPLSTEGRMAIGAPLASATVSATVNGVPRPEARIVSIDRAVPTNAPTGYGATVNSAPLPGAVAALPQPDTTGSLSAGTEKTDPNPRAVTVRDARSNRDDEIYRRQRQAARRPPLPEPFKFPTYLGAGPPKYFASQAYTDRGSFSARFFEKSKRSGETR